jgi:hypothetical protein
MNDLLEIPYEERVGRFVYGEAEEKKLCRDWKVNCLAPYSKKAKNVLTLSAETLAFEEMLLTNSRFSKLAVLDSYEIDQKTYTKGLPKYKKLKKQHQIINYKRDNIFNANFGLYDVIDLDLCGSHTIDLMNEFLCSFQQFKKGIVFITLTRHIRRSNLLNNLKDYGAKNYDEFRDKKFAQYLKKHCGLEQYAKPYVYSNKSVSNKAKQMIVYAFKKGVELNFNPQINNEIPKLTKKIKLKLAS